MAQTTTLQRPPQNGSQSARIIVGRVTGSVYIVSPLGFVTVDTTDSPTLIAEGWVQTLGGAGQANSGTVTIDFGAFPGTPMTQVTVALQDVADPNAAIDAWIIPAATVDHTADEHVADPPRVIAVNSNPVTGGSFTIYGLPSGRDLPVPPGTPFGNTANSQQSVAQQQLMPYGKWNVGWAFSP